MFTVDRMLDLSIYSNSSLQLRNAILRNRNVILPRSFNLAVAHLVAQQMRRDVHVGEVVPLVAISSYRASLPQHYRKLDS